MACGMLVLGFLALLIAAAVHVVWLETAYLLDELDGEESKNDPGGHMGHDRELLAAETGD